ncbi:HAD family hydrolase [Psychromonas sp. RZ22]|uniref:HAD family hydrolase n=1 Tax=Psychromonas algarum TaxID=2555643 RepID=UPI001068C12B|nr:HAD-IA family hydrolase [Psychromonas sp. RZ22]TEW54314.1 HAD family hydrolase [Psychromonas sp. RZ22]
MDLIIFDCDGTLVDSEYLCNLGMEQQLAEMGLIVNAEELVSQYRGVKLDIIIKALEKKFATSFHASFEAEYRQKVNALFEQHLKANEGVIELIESLTVPICIASSAPRIKIKHALKVTGLDKYFNDEHIFSAHEVGSWKPEPGLFLHAAKAMNVAPEKCSVIEDSVVGLQAANAANMKSIYYAPDALEKNALASMQVRHMSELINQV